MVELNEDLVNELMTLTDEEVFSFEKNNKQFIILNKTEYNTIHTKSKCFDLIEKLKKCNK